MGTFGGVTIVEQNLDDILLVSPSLQKMAAQEAQALYGDTDAQVSF
jgi:hypothetical protein